MDPIVPLGGSEEEAVRRSNRVVAGQKRPRADSADQEQVLAAISLGALGGEGRSYPPRKLSMEAWARNTDDGCSGYPWMDCKGDTSSTDDWGFGIEERFAAPPTPKEGAVRQFQDWDVTDGELNLAFAADFDWEAELAEPKKVRSYEELAGQGPTPEEPSTGRTIDDVAPMWGGS